MIATYRLYHVFELGTLSSADLEVSCCQNIDSVANSNKMVNIRSGHGNCRVKCPMSCFVTPFEKLRAVPAWIQIKSLAEKVKTGTAVPADYIIVPDYERPIGELIFQLRQPCAKRGQRKERWERMPIK